MENEFFLSFAYVLTVRKFSRPSNSILLCG